jgi:hypothetical protein
MMILNSWEIPKSVNSYNSLSTNILAAKSDKGIVKITIQAWLAHRDLSQSSIGIIDYSAFIIANHGQAIVRLIVDEHCERYKQQYR